MTTQVEDSRGAEVEDSVSQTQMLKGIMGSLDIVVVTDRHGHIRLFNANAEQHLEVRSTSDVLQFFVKEDGSPDGERIRDCLRKARRVRNLKTHVRGASERIIPTFLSLDCVCEDGDKVKYVVGIIRISVAEPT